MRPPPLVPQLILRLFSSHYIAKRHKAQEKKRALRRFDMKFHVSYKKIGKISAGTGFLRANIV